MYQVFIFLQDHLHFFLHFFFTFMEHFFLDDPIFVCIYFLFKTTRCRWLNQNKFVFWEQTLLMGKRKPQHRQMMQSSLMGPTRLAADFTSREKN